ncbi:hypothetical protein MPTK1_5g07816 [Marchantia polymorpha subsp. ruderalis]
MRQRSITLENDFFMIMEPTPGSMDRHRHFRCGKLALGKLMLFLHSRTGSGTFRREPWIIGFLASDQSTLRGPELLAIVRCMFLLYTCLCCI